VGVASERFDNGGGHYLAVQAFGNEFRGNDITGTNETPIGNSITEAPSYNTGIYISTADIGYYDGNNDVTVSGDTTNTIVEDNTVRNKQYAVTLTHSSYGTVLANNKVAGITTNFVNDTGAHNTYSINNAGAAASQSTVAQPTFSPGAGTYSSAQTVTIASSTAGATIRYTTDGSAPNASSRIYSAPLTVTPTQTVKAYAAKAGMLSSAVATAAYTSSGGGGGNLTVEAESYSDTSGISNYGSTIGGIEANDWVKFSNVNLGSGYTTLRIRYANGESTTKTAEVRLDSLIGTQIGTFSTPTTGGWSSWTETTTALTGASGTHDVYVKFSGATDYDWFRFEGGGGGTPPGTLRIQAESYADMNGVSNFGSAIGGLNNGSWVKYSGVNLGSGYGTLRFRFANGESTTKTAVVRLGSLTGTQIGTFSTPATGGWRNWTEGTTTLTGASGTHDIYIQVSGATDFDWFQFESSAPTPITLEAESYSDMSGIANFGTAIGGIDANDWVKYSNVNLGSGYGTLRLRFANGDTTGKTAEVRLDSLTGTQIGTFSTPVTGGWNVWQETTATLTGASGTHDVYIKFSGMTDYDWFRFE
jgi:hypothetical protein